MSEIKPSLIFADKLAEMFSKACEYGIRATIYIMQQTLNEKRIGLKDIAREIDSPMAFTAKILQQLVKHQLINSVKGPTGGFEINHQKKMDLNLRDIIGAIEGEQLLFNCVLGLKQCNPDHPCPLHDQYKKVRNPLNKLFETTTIINLATELNTGQSHLKSNV